MLRFKHLIPAAAFVVGLVSAGYAQKNPEDVKAKETVYDKPREFKIYASSSPVKAFAVNRNTLWFATDEIVINQPLNAKTHSKLPKIGNISSANTKAVIFDVRGRLWVACESGVAVNTSGAGTTFTSYTTDDGLPSNNALALTSTGTGDVWAGTDGGAARFRDGTWQKFTTADGLLSNTVQALVTDSKGLVYLGTNKGLNVWDGAKFQSYTAKTTGGNGLEWNNVKVLSASDKNVIWMTDGPETNNINNFNGSKWNRYMEVQKGITSIITLSGPNRTWTYFGSESGILRFNGEDWVDKAEVHGIPAEQVYAMSRDDQGNLWLGMEKGVMMYPNPLR